MRTRSIFVAMGAHIATVTEQAVRDHLAADLEQRSRHLEPDEYTGGPAYTSGVRYGLTLAADITRGTA